MGIVDKHLQQKGFALVDSSGLELFCVASDRDDFRMWVSAISNQIEHGTPPDDVVNEKPALEPSESPHADHELFSSSHEQHMNITDVKAVDPDQLNPTIESCEEVTSSTTATDSIDDNDSDSTEMDTISLSGSDDAIDGPSQHQQIEQKITTTSTVKLVAEPESEVAKTPSIPKSRELLSKSRFASSKFNSALQSAKGGVISASEKGRVLRQALEANVTTTAPKAELSHKLSGLKQNASAKVTKMSSAVRTSVQEHSKAAFHGSQQKDPNSSQLALNSGLEALGSESQVLDFPDNTVQPNRQEQMKKKLADFDQSVSSTMRRLKLDEKLNTISMVVKHAASEGQIVARQISSTGSVSQLKSEHQRQLKSIKFDARETFSSHSDIPVRVKSIKAGAPLIMHNDDYLSDMSRTLLKIRGNWMIEVKVQQKISEITSLNAEGSEVSTESRPMQVERHQLIEITSTDIGSGSATTVSKSLSDIIFFHAVISESLSSHVKCAAEVTHRVASNEFDPMDTMLQRMSPLERIQASGSILQGVLDTSKANNMCVDQGHCKSAQVCISNVGICTQLFLCSSR
jgi:hypothetical protein